MLNILSISSISIALIFLVYSIISYKKKSIIYAVRDGKEKVTVLKDAITILCIKLYFTHIGDFNYLYSFQLRPFYTLLYWYVLDSKLFIKVYGYKNEIFG